AFLAKMKRANRNGADSPNAIKPDMINVGYGPHERNVLDFWKAKADKPTALVVFIHGGGFRAGSKENYWPDAKLAEILKSGISCASINYRYLDTAPIQDILHDCARAVQFLRSKAGEWNIDKTRVAAIGGSAGAGTSLWLSTHDDMADASATDPVLRESTRVCCAALYGTQATYDVLRWESFLGPAQPGFWTNDGELPLFYGLGSVADMKSAAGEKARHECDMLSWISKDDAPVFIDNALDVPKPANRNEWLHTTQHARTVKKELQAAGVECVLVQDEKETKPKVGDFLRKYLHAGGQ
ncbi:MAG: esterase, partial [Verrucomicrobiaceae bacterium]|nr:esterase [Verrucomicrobiaceae bacterium]